jgi:hypothetical protein
VFDVVSVHQPKVSQEENVEGDAERLTVRPMAHRKEGTGEHGANDNRAENDKFSPV